MTGMIKKKLQVFVSSTYLDMIPERQAAVDAILRAGHSPAGMELFAAGDETQLETIRRWIDDSDIFMLILGGRYGSIEPKSGKSYIQLEYEYAIERQIPFFAAVMSESWLDQKVQAAGKDAIELTHGLKLAEFRKIVTGKTSRFFHNVDELKLIVLESLLNIERTYDLAGWIKGSELVQAKTALDEMARLQGENSQLHQRIRLFEINSLASHSLSPKELAEKLTDDARLLLVDAVNNEESIELFESPHGSYYTSGGQRFFMTSPRDEARWTDAVAELETLGLIRKAELGPRVIEEEQLRAIYKLTKRGFDTADQARLLPR